MELRQAIEQRRSIRKFQKQEVPRELIEEILQLSLWSPSWGNTAPWEILVASGEALARYQEANHAALFAGQKPNPDLPMPEAFPAANQERYRHLGKSVLIAQGIAREDEKGRLNFYGEMFKLFEVPALVLFLLDKELELPYPLMDLGIFIQSLCLAAADQGLGSCIMAVSVNYPDLAREILGAPQDKLLVMGVGLGWPEEEAAINRFERQRPGLDEVCTWVE